MQIPKQISFYTTILVIAGISALMHWRIFSLDLIGIHVWRQTQTQTVIENFSQEDFNILNPRINNRGNGDGIFRMEFPIMQWLYSCFYKIFGDYIIITRILSFLTGLLSVGGIYVIAIFLFRDSVVAAATAWCFNFSPLFYYYTLNPLPDNFALASVIVGTVFLLFWHKSDNRRYFLLSVLFFVAGALAKLPFILFGSIWLVILFVDNKNNSLRITFNKSGLSIPLILIAGLLPFFAWYLWVVPNWNSDLTIGILSSDIGIDPVVTIMQHHLVSTLPELIVNYGSLIFFLVGIYSIIKRKPIKNIYFLAFATCGILIILYFFFEINQIGKEHDYYLMPFLPMIFLLIGAGLKEMLFSKKNLVRRSVILILLILPITAFLRADSRWNEQKPGFNADIYNNKMGLRNAVPDSSLCIIGNDISGFIHFYYMRKKGWSFYKNQLDSSAIAQMIEDGAEYLYCDSRKIDSRPDIQRLIKRIVTEKGSVRVYQLTQKH